MPPGPAHELFNEDAAVLSRVSWAGRESRSDTSYAWNNFRRYHHNRLVIQWTCSGFGFFADEHGRQLVPEGRAMLFTYDEESRYGYPEEATQPYEFIALNFSPSRTLEPLFQEVRLRFGAVVQMELRSAAAVFLREIFDRYQARSFRDALQESELILGLFHAIYREQQEGASARDPVAAGFHAICNHFRSPMNLKTLAEDCGISREHFIRAFCARYHESPGAMLRNLRLQHARTMLLSTRLAVQHIAEDCGFSSSNSFCRAYRRRFARSPQEERAGGAGSLALKQQKKREP